MSKIKINLIRLKFLLIILTIIELAYISIIFTNEKLWASIDLEYKANWIIRIFHLVVVGIIIWHIWKRTPIKESKWNHIFMIVFLGLIGMWLWMPNKKEIKKIAENNNT